MLATVRPQNMSMLRFRRAIMLTGNMVGSGTAGPMIDRVLRPGNRQLKPGEQDWVLR